MAELRYQDILYFWFEEIEPPQWWVKDQKFDNIIKQRFGEFHRAAVACELYHWRESAKGRLAEIIVLDQFSRNIYRDSAAAFAHDSQALVLAQAVVALALDKDLTTAQRNFIYMPYMHSESSKVHELAVTLYESNDSPQTLEFEHKHKVIIDRFGRYPHRNKILGRSSTEAELAFLSQENSSF